jgi:hypothetical protein
MMKTNNNWYPYEQDGNYYKLINGVLISSPMNADGSLDGEEAEVDFAAFENDQEKFEKDGKVMTTTEYLRSIEEELKCKE